MASKLTPVDGYIRVSRVGGREGDSFISPDLQRESIERVCAANGLRVVKWFEELDASGGDSDRVKWLEAIQRVVDGKTRGIVVWNLSRFSRSLKDGLTQLERIEDVGGKLYSEEGQLDKFSRVIRLAIAEDERDRAKAAFARATANAISRGVYIAAKIPFGYQRDPETRALVIDEDRAPIVKELFERRAKGVSWAKLSAYGAEQCGHQFTKTGLSWMLSNPAYLGVARQGEIVNEKAHEPIVSKKLFDAAAAAKGRKPVHTGASKNLLLRGIITCASCGYKLTVGNTTGARQANGKREKIITYTCRNLKCPIRTTVVGEDADKFVCDFVLSILGHAGIMDGQDTSQDLVAAQKELEETEYALSQFKSDKRAIVTLGVDAWNDLLEEYVMARDVAQTAVETIEEESTISYRDIPAMWDEWTNESRSEFLSKVISECVATPAQRRKIPIAERITVDLKMTLLHGSVPQDDLFKAAVATVIAQHS